MCGTAANFALLGDPLFRGTACAFYLLVLCRMIQLKSERCQTAANCALLKDPLVWGAVRASYLLVLCNIIQLQIN